jgi:uncharacterized membrane protein YccF (DUF307 family)
MGARLGAVSGMLGFLFPSVFVVAIAVYAPDKFREALTTQFAATPYNRETIRQAIEALNTPDGLISAVVGILLIGYFTFIVGASIGGAWYSAWVQKRNRG